MNAEEFLKQKLDMKSMPLSLTLKNDNLFALMEEYYEARREEVVNECRDELLKHLFPMKHTNGYPSMAVPHATILELPALMNLATHKSQTNKK